MNKKIILEVKNLSVSLSGKKILENINFSVQENEVFVIMGPNGAGKTVLLKAILELLPHTGKVNWKTKKIGYLPPREFLQSESVPPLSVMEFFQIKSKSLNRIQKLISTLGISKEILKQQFSELSTGQLQRVKAAWALLGNPEVLLIDEPTSGMDVEGEKTIYELLHKFWKEKNLTILLVTHDLSIVWGHANRVMCLNKKVIRIGKPEKVLTKKTLEDLYKTEVKIYKHEHTER